MILFRNISYFGSNDKFPCSHIYVSTPNRIFCIYLARLVLGNVLRSSLYHLTQDIFLTYKLRRLTVLQSVYYSPEMSNVYIVSTLLGCYIIGNPTILDNISN